MSSREKWEAMATPQRLLTLQMAMKVHASFARPGYRCLQLNPIARPSAALLSFACIKPETQRGLFVA